MYCYIIGERSIANLTILGSQLNLTEHVPESYESTVRNASASDFRAITTSYLADSTRANYDATNGLEWWRKFLRTKGWRETELNSNVIFLPTSRFPCDDERLSMMLLFVLWIRSPPNNVFGDQVFRSLYMQFNMSQAYHVAELWNHQLIKKARRYQAREQIDSNKIAKESNIKYSVSGDMLLQIHNKYFSPPFSTSRRQPDIILILAAAAGWLIAHTAVRVASVSHTTPDAAQLKRSIAWDEDGKPPIDHLGPEALWSLAQQWGISLDRAVIRASHVRFHVLPRHNLPPGTNATRYTTTAFQRSEKQRELNKSPHLIHAFCRGFSIVEVEGVTIIWPTTKTNQFGVRPETSNLNMNEGPSVQAMIMILLQIVDLAQYDHPDDSFFSTPCARRAKGTLENPRIPGPVVDGTVSRTRLLSRNVNEIARLAAESAGLPAKRYTAKSFKIFGITTNFDQANNNRISPRVAADHSRHASISSAIRYVHDLTIPIGPVHNSNPTQTGNAYRGPLSVLDGHGNGSVRTAAIVAYDEFMARLYNPVIPINQPTSLSPLHPSLTLLSVRGRCKKQDSEHHYPPR